MLGALPVAAVVLDQDDRFRFANPAAELFFKLSAPSLEAQSLRDLLPPDNRLFSLLAHIHQIHIGRIVRDNTVFLHQ